MIKQEKTLITISLCILVGFLGSIDYTGTAIFCAIILAIYLLD